MGYRQHMLRSQSALEAVRATYGIPNRYHDPVFSANRKKYIAFVRRCAQIGLIHFVSESWCELGLFYVREKDERLRLIIDCRRANQHFVLPPGVDQVTGNGLSQVELD